MSNEGDGSRIARERAVIDYVRENCSVSVPKVVAADTGGDVPYLATAPVSGQNFIHLWSDASATRRAALARQVGKSLATVHSLRFEKPRPRRRWQCDHPRTRNRAMDGRSHRHGSRTTGTCLLEPVRPPFRCGGFSRRSES
ncbi:phosphotransferase family protein [Haladaptatus litoreus]|uniref:phosphotransferase family protein n=1 Tax=Haladaptatus litoreus TaxID=553468 RepID=UPI0024820705|nr:phosphotransferase [Haladaptatus litoreus]